MHRTPRIVRLPHGRAGDREGADGAGHRDRGRSGRLSNVLLGASSGLSLTLLVTDLVDRLERRRDDADRGPVDPAPDGVERVSPMTATAASGRRGRATIFDQPFGACCTDQVWLPAPVHTSCTTFAPPTADRHHHPVVVAAQRHPAGGRAGVAYDVGERLSGDPVRAHLDGRREWAEVLRVEPDVQIPGSEPVDQPLERRRQAGVQGRGEARRRPGSPPRRSRSGRPTAACCTVAASSTTRTVVAAPRASTSTVRRSAGVRRSRRERAVTLTVPTARFRARAV